MLKEILSLVLSSRRSIKTPYPDLEEGEPFRVEPSADTNNGIVNVKPYSFFSYPINREELKRLIRREEGGNRGKCEIPEILNNYLLL